MDASQASFGAELRRLRVVAGLSIAALAGRVHYSKSHLSKIETGVKQPSVELARQCDAVLGGDGALARAAQPSPRPAPVPIGVAEADWPIVADAWPRPHGDETSLAAFRSIFEHVRTLGQSQPSVTILPMLAAYTLALRALAPNSLPATRGRALVLAGRFAEFAGWMAQEAGDDVQALRWTDRAVELATEGGDRDLEAYALVRRALVAYYRHDPVQTVALAERVHALRPHLRVRGLAALREAQGQAIAGDYDRCFRALDRAATLLGSASADIADGPILGTSMIADPVAITTGWCLLDLGRPTRGVEVLRREIDRIPDHAHRARARYGARLSLGLACAGDLEQACAALEPVLDASARMDSATVRVDLRDLARTLNRWHAHPSVRDAMPRLNAILHDTVAR